MNIPAVGGTRGIFEIFVPGAFLLINLAYIGHHLLTLANRDAQSFILDCISRPVLALVLIVCFGYLIGVMLRLLRAERADRLSAKWNQRFNPYCRYDDGSLKLWAYEEFPYIGWIGEVCRLYLPPGAVDFYNKTWAARKREGQNRQFFNFCKTMINSVDERAANEIYSAEALSRYISGMFYSLVIASCLLLVAVVLQLVIFDTVAVVLITVLLFYLLATVAILRYFRFIRIKEVEMVFAATFKNKCELFDVLHSET